MLPEEKPRERMDIEGGPSKYDFLDSLGRRKRPESEVTFKIVRGGARKTTITVRIELIMKFDANTKLPSEEGHEWHFICHKDYDHNDRKFPITFRGNYSTTNRTGWIEGITDDEYLFMKKWLRGLA